MGKHPAWLGKAMQSGGRADWQGEGDSGKPNKEKSAALSKEADADRTQAKGHLVWGAVPQSNLTRSIQFGLATRFGKKAADEDKAAAAASKRGDVAEGRKRGGRASKKKG